MSHWHCSKCNKYSDPQNLDYTNGECADCQEGIMPLNLVRQMADREERLNCEVREFYVDYIHPRIVQCETMEQLGAIWSEVSRACAGNDGTLRDMPGLLEIERVFSYDAMRQKLSG